MASMSTRRTKLKAAETQQVIGSDEAGQPTKLGSESAFRRFGRFIFGSKTRKATAETSANQKQEADKTHKGKQQQQQKEEDCETMDYCYKNSELPNHILIDILSRLPTKTLLKFRLVCKDWLSLISEPHFAYLHLSKSRLGVLSVPYDPSPKLNVVDLRISPSSSYDDPKVLNTTINLPKGPNIRYTIMNSCNGLLCLIDHDHGGPVCICNPLLGELVTLPNCPSGRYPYIRSRYYAFFGFSPKTTQYKVIRSFMFNYELDMGNIKYEAEIYTLGEGSWRSLGTVPTMVDNSFFNAFLNGSLHWISHVRGVDSMIYSFDFGSEQFRVVPEPSEFGRVGPAGKYHCSMGVLQGCLCICDLRERCKVRVWVMKDYGVKESWIKDFVIVDLFFFNRVPIMLMGDRHKLLIARSNSCLSVYDIIASKRPRNLHTFQRYGDYFISAFDIGSKCSRNSHTFPRSSTDCIAHVPSLLSLKDVAKGECFEKLSCMKETGSSSCKDAGKRIMAVLRVLNYPWHL